MTIKIEIMNLNLLEIFGNNKRSKKPKVEIWKEKYSIFNSQDVYRWIQTKIQEYRAKGKDPARFNVVGYLRDLQDYCDYYKCADPSELLHEDIDHRNTRLREYLSYLLETGKNKVSVKNGVQSHIKSFFSARGFPIKYQLPCEDQGLNKNELILDKQDIKLIYNNLYSTNYRLILKIESQVGFRIDDILTELTKDDNGTPKYNFEKYEDHYFIRNFETQKEKVTINFVFFPIELSNLLISATNTLDLTKLDLRTLFISRYGEKKIDANNYLTRLKEIVEKLGLEGNIKTHCVRKYFTNSIRKAKIDPEFREHLIGHKGTNLPGAYKTDLRNIDWFYEQWLKAQERILIDSQIVDKTDQKVIELEKKFAEEKGLKDQVIAEQAKQINDQKAEITDLKEMMKLMLAKIEKIEKNN